MLPLEKLKPPKGHNILKNVLTKMTHFLLTGGALENCFNYAKVVQLPIVNHQKLVPVKHIN